MTIGRGKYDKLCSYVKRKSLGRSVAIIVINGKIGNGFSCQFEDVQDLRALPDILEHMAKQIRADSARVVDGPTRQS